ncbi:M23 family metallopeptidase [Algibacter pacificus]|uniref:M23 family metallopeptidase n=1 Tax=Algibacter pacificus TaxID=2599389 RepID=UPI0011C8A1A2|nr:M23 family metallopeptidase [Algibacter pacificus]
MKFTLYLLLFCSFFLKAQNNYPQDYFKSPLDVTLVLAGTFAELRSNHFHSGMDLKTKQRTGLKVKASASGFVSRIKIAHYGYGKALYITHPNGYTTVYAHLQKFAPEIEAYVKKKQYEAESYEIELFPTPEELPVIQGNTVAYSGNTGSSGGPHLHFEIRNKEEHPLNPMLFGIDILDTKAPIIQGLYAYPLDKNSFINKKNTKQKINLIPLKNGNFVTKTIDAVGNIGFGVKTIDRQDLAGNSNGVYHIETLINGAPNFEIDFKEFSFDETKHINALIDYEHYITKKERIQLLFKQNNPLSLLKPIINNGVLNIKDSTNSVYKIRVSDFKNNDTWITLNIRGSKNTDAKIKEEKITPYFINNKQVTNLKEGKIRVNFYKDTFYKDFYMNFEVENDTLFLHDNTIPTQKNFNISFDISNYNETDKSKLFIARLVGRKNYPVYSTTERKGDTLITSTKYLGKYALATDNTPPTIKAANFKNKQWLSNFRYLKIKISDNLSGISNYRATINGKFILMEYEYKTNTLTYDFNDGDFTDINNNLKVIVTDNVGNNSTFEALFYRK